MTELQPASENGAAQLSEAPAPEKPPSSQRREQRAALLIETDGDGGSGSILAQCLCWAAAPPSASEAAPPAARGAALEQRLRRTPVWGAAANTIAFMCVPRSLPACFAATGWSLGLGALAWSSVVTYETGQLLGTMCAADAELTSFPALGGAAFAKWRASRAAARAESVDDGARARWNAAGRRATLAMQFATYYLTAVAELIYFEQYCGQLFARSPLCQWQWLLVVALVTLPVMQVPSFHESRWAALTVAVLPMAFNVAVFLYEVLLVRPWSCEPGPTHTPPTASQGFLGLTAFAYAFGGHGLYPEQIREMADARQWPKVMRLTYGVALPLYWGCGLLGYAAYGDFAQANINLNFPENGANVASLWVQLLQEVYFMLSTNLVMVLAIEIHLGIDPARAWTPAWRGLPPWAARLLLRTLFLGSQVFVAQLLLSGEGDTLLSLQSLIGAIGMTAFTYFLPYAAYLVLAPEPLTRRRTAWCAANVVIGVVVMLAGLYASLADLVASSAGLFAGDCRIEYAYSPSSPDDPCFESGPPL